MRHPIRWLCIGMIVLIGLIIAGSVFAPETAALHPITLESPAGNSIPLNVELAVTPGELEKGLMYRTYVSHGMLFMFSETRPLTFWMKNTLVPLDIVFFDANGMYVSSTTMEPCTADPCATYASDEPARFALEMPAGYIARNQIGKNWKLEQ